MPVRQIDLVKRMYHPPANPDAAGGQDALGRLGLLPPPRPCSRRSMASRARIITAIGSGMFRRKPPVALTRLMEPEASEK
jgi:hypothetical protein